MNDIKDIVTKPIFFERNRVYRIYHGGKPFKALFDDGYDDNYTQLFPLLQKYNMKATIFMIAGDIGKPHKLTRPQLRRKSLLAAGTHRLLRQITVLTTKRKRPTGLVFLML